MGEDNFGVKLPESGTRCEREAHATQKIRGDPVTPQAVSCPQPRPCSPYLLNVE